MIEFGVFKVDHLTVRSGVGLGVTWSEGGEEEKWRAKL